MIEYYQLEQFVAIAEEGTLSKAAQRLLISQPALTRSLQRLESDLGLQLFDRKKNKITLNENGQLAIPLIQNLLQERDQMIKTLQAYENSKFMISIGSCAPVPIQGLHYILNDLYPEMQIKDVLDLNSSNLLDGLKKHEFSLIVLTHPIDNEEFDCFELFKENLYISVPPAHPLALFDKISFDDLDGESVLLLSRIGFWNEICLKMIPHSHLLIQEDQSVFYELTKASALPTFKSNITILKENATDNRVSIPITNPEAHATYYAVFHRENQKLCKPVQDKISHIDWTKVV